MKVSTSHTFPISEDTFWKEIYFNEEYNNTLYIEHIHAEAYETVEFEENDDEIIRQVRITPKQEAPKIITKFIKGKLSYLEKGRFDKKDKIFRFNVTPSAMTDKLTINGKVFVESRGGSITRTIDLDLTAKIFGVGGQVEKFIGGQIRKGYDESFPYTIAWIKTHNLK